MNRGSLHTRCFRRSSFLDTDELEMTSHARKVSTAFETRAYDLNRSSPHTIDIESFLVHSPTNGSTRSSGFFFFLTSYFDHSSKETQDLDAY